MLDSGALKGAADCAGGIVGKNNCDNLTVENCINYGDISKNHRCVGSIVGLFPGGTAEVCRKCGYLNKVTYPVASTGGTGRRATLPGGEPKIKVTELPRVDKQGYIKPTIEPDPNDDGGYSIEINNSENNNVVEPQTQPNTQNSNSNDKNAVEASADTESTTTGSFLSGGTVWIIVGVAAAVIIAAVVYVVLRKKKH